VKYLLTLLFFLTVSPTVSADDKDYTATFREKGYKYWGHGDEQDFQLVN